MHDEGKEARERRARSHSVRAAILDLLAKDACELTASQIRAELPGDPTLVSVNYHLGILADNRLVVEEDDGFRLT
jgi:predicted transcriptional regulator